MTIPRIYYPGDLETRTECRLGQDHHKYLKQVLRLKPGNEIRIFDGFGREFAALILGFSEREVRVTLGERIPQDARAVRLTLAQAVPKAGKMDLIVKSAAELGVDRIIPFVAARSVSRPERDKGEAKAARWRKIVQEASRCTRSTHMPEVTGVGSFQTMLSLAPEGALKMIFWEEENERTIKDVLTSPDAADAEHFFIIVGPEGGLSIDEINAAREAGFMSVSLGKQILKVETAAAAIVSIIQYEKGIFSRRSREE